MEARPKKQRGRTKPADAKPAVSFDDLIAANTGQAIPSQLWQSGKQRDQELTAQTARIAGALESGGRSARYERRGKVVLLGEVTGTIAATHDYRSICFLPKMAQIERRAMERALQLFIAEHALGRFVRLAVFTAGQRIPIGAPLRKFIAAFQRKLSRWASEARQHDMKVLFRGTEFTIDRAGTIHVHANVLFVPQQKVSGEAWRDFLRMTHQRMGAHWKDCGPLRDAKEAIKYSFKPAEIDHLPPADLCWLHDELSRLKLMQPMGIFQEFCRTLEARREKVGRITRTPGKPSELVRVKKQQRGPRPANGTPRQNPIENEIVARTAPAAISTPYAEPHTVVRNYAPHPTTPGGEFRLRVIAGRQAQAHAAWKANGAPDPADALAAGQVLHDPHPADGSSPRDGDNSPDTTG